MDTLYTHVNTHTHTHTHTHFTHNQTAVDAMMCNLPPNSSDGTPSLLRHQNVVTFFHEFGHIMHGLCSEGDANSTTLAKCPRDFVEAPSQMLENWCWEPEVLSRLSKHYVTGETLPTGLVESMVAAKNVNQALFMMRQVYLAKLDLEIHNEKPPQGAEGLQTLVDTLRPRLTGIDNPAGCNMLRNFGHLMVTTHTHTHTHACKLSCALARSHGQNTHTRLCVDVLACMHTRTQPTCKTVPTHTEPVFRCVLRIHVG